MHIFLLLATVSASASARKVSCTSLINGDDDDDDDDMMTMMMMMMILIGRNKLVHRHTS